MDQGSLMDTLYSITTTSMNIKKVYLKPYNRNLIKFSRKYVPMEGTIKLRITMGTLPLVVNMDVNFLLVNAPNNAYNAILGRMLLNKARVIVSIPHLLMKFPTPSGTSQV